MSTVIVDFILGQVKSNKAVTNNDVNDGKLELHECFTSLAVILLFLASILRLVVNIGGVEKTPFMTFEFKNLLLNSSFPNSTDKCYHIKSNDKCLKAENTYEKSENVCNTFQFQFNEFEWYRKNRITVPHPIPNCLTCNCPISTKFGTKST